MGCPCGQSAQTEATNLNIKASDLWNFFQAKTIRRTVVLTAAEAKLAEATAVADTEAKQPIAKQVAEWQKTAARYRSEPETKEGTTELFERAREAEHERDALLARYHNYELASAAFQIGIVLCSATVITGMVLLAWLAGGVAVIGLPATEPLRILICTDAAREGINLQTYCADLIHIDLPWNPSRLEQRNGRAARELIAAAMAGHVATPNDGRGIGRRAMAIFSLVSAGTV